MKQPKSIYRLVLTNGVVLTHGTPWPGPDNVPFKDAEGNPIPNARIWLFAYAPGVFEEYEDDGTVFKREIQPAMYKVLMGVFDGSPHVRGVIDPQTKAELTHVYEVPLAQVLMVCRTQLLEDAVKEFTDLIKEDNDMDEEDEKSAAAQPAPQPAPTPS